MELFENVFPWTSTEKEIIIFNSPFYIFNFKVK